MQNSDSQNAPIQRRTWTPKYHFFKKGHWLNDPNGLFYFNDTYHLFFQLNPDDTVWGNMHWGHAVSTDLIAWEHKPTAIYAEPDGLGYIFSGGAIVDHFNSSGFAEDDTPPIIATFTQHSKAEEQVQSIAYSLDEGETFTMFENNPVIPNPGLKDFRDPKVIWFEKEQVWIKSVVAGQCVHFYQSKNLQEWSKTSEFGEGYGAHGGVWECPDLFPLVCKDTGKELWVLIISINPGGPNGGSATQYFIGNFDGKAFHPIDREIRWLDYGTDCYAAITWDNTPNIQNERTYVGWMSNWKYANETPDNSWRGAMTVPRNLSLHQTNLGFALRTVPTADFSTITHEVKKIENLTHPISVPEAYSMHFVLAADSQATTITWKNDLDQKFNLNIDLANLQLLADRTDAGFTDKGFASVATVPLQSPLGKTIKFDIFMDACSIEIFIDDGLYCCTMLLFPSTPLEEIIISENQIDKNISDLTFHFFDSSVSTSSEPLSTHTEIESIN
jgi:fructan beta-fructosidase